MAADIDYFRARFPEFSDKEDFPTVRVQIFLDDARAEMSQNEDLWGGQFDQAHSYLAAHLLVVGTKTENGSTSASTGSIASKSAGGVSVSYNHTPKKSSSDYRDFLMSTAYGQRFITIRNRHFVGVMVAT